MIKTTADVAPGSQVDSYRNLQFASLKSLLAKQ